MPTYDYVCRGCGHAFEAFHSIKADPIKLCPECGEERVERLISGGGGLLFKGSGFYETDYRSSSYQEAAKADSSGGGDGGGDAKPDAKSDAKPDAAPAAAESKPSSGSDSAPAPSAPASSGTPTGGSAPASKPD